MLLQALTGRLQWRTKSTDSLFPQATQTDRRICFASFLRKPMAGETDTTERAYSVQRRYGMYSLVSVGLQNTELVPAGADPAVVAVC